MNIKPHFKSLALILPIFWHLWLVFAGIFFISPEIFFYPYLTSKGFVPYQGLIDQHFPLLFFGPLNLSQLGVTNIQEAELLFIVLIILTDISFLLILSSKIKSLYQRLLLLLLFTNLQVILGGYHFWIETFILPLLLFGIYFLKKKNAASKYLGILFFSFVIGLRPTLLPFTAIIIWFLHELSLSVFLVFFSVPLLEVFWLYKNNLVSHFLTITSFNANYYATQARQLPSLRQSLLSFFALDTVFHQSHSLVCLLLILSGSIGAFPRFELYHLLPVLAIFPLFIPKRPLHIPIFLIISFFIVLYIRRPFISTNYYDSPALKKLSADIVGTYPSDKFYFFGGPDELYLLINQAPPGQFYLPSLPWYLSNKEFADKQIKALESNKETFVVTNNDSRLNNQTLLDYGQTVWQYIDQNYQKIGQIGQLSVYRR